jgi:hypothetical protein
MQTFSKIIYTSILWTLLITNISAQMHDGKYGNEWIIHSQEYFKFNVFTDGFYYLDKQTLERDIPNVQQGIHHDLQLFHLGKEVPIYVHIVNGEVEYISFYAEKNKGDLDVNLYRDAHNHLNPEYSLISDTSSYFLTWAANGNTNHYQDYTSNFNGVPAKESYFIHESKTVLSNAWNKGKYRVYGTYILSNGIFDYGEGFASSFNKNSVVSVNTPYPTSLGPAPSVKVRGYAFGFSYHTLQVKTNSHVASHANYYGDSVINVTHQVGHSDIDPLVTDVEINGLNGSQDKYAISVVSISYPRSFNFEGKSEFKFKLAASSTRKYLEINNFDGAGLPNVQDVYLYDMTNSLKIHCFWNGNKVYAELPSSAVDRDLILVNQSKKQYIGLINGTDFENYTIAQGDYIVISHPDLFTDSEGNNPVLDYCFYRASTGYAPVLVPIQRLYDQFAYGVNNHPMAIKNFAAYIKQHWQTVVPENIFLIGKGRVYTSTRASNLADNLIPTFGYPPSDNLLLAPIHSDVPVIPVGRLAATDGDQVRDYLSKIKKLENTAKDSLDFDNQKWRKQMIHLGGGANYGEHNILKNHLLNIEPLMEDGQSGIDVHSFFKEQDEHVSIPNSQLIDSLINNGVSMVTFFGHGSTKGFDFYLNTPEHYKNKNKYPLVMALGCYNGTIYDQAKLISERFIFKPEGGAIGYIGFVDAVTIGAAQVLSSSFYNHVNTDLYGGGIGELMKKALEDVTSVSNYEHIPTYQMGCQYLVFHGDPALKLNYRTTPDFYIDTAAISTSPEVISEDLRNFILEVDIHNLGKYKDSSLLVKVVRTHPFGLVDTFYRTVSIPQNKTKVKFTCLIDGYQDFGLNKFSIYVDPSNAHAEEPNPKAESNNTVLDYNVWVGNPTILPTYPKEYSIVSDSTLTIIAMASNAFETQYTWYLEMDTCKYFNSPTLVQYSSQTNTNLIEWTPGIVLENEQVYYWRVQAVDANFQMTDWAYSSFVYLSGISGGGWNQSHVHQYQNNDFDNLHLEEGQSELFHFNPTLYEISAKTGFIPNGIDDENLAVYQNGSKVNKCRCSGFNGTYVSVFDPNTLEFWTMPGGSTRYGAVNCDPGNRTAHAFLFNAVTLIGQQNLSNFITDSIPNGHLVLVYTLNNSLGQAWSPTLVNYLKSQGATKIDSFVNTLEERSYGIAYKNNVPSYPYFSEEVGYDKEAVINVYTVADKDWHEGKMESPLIGPAQSWEKLDWSSTQVEADLSDSVSVDIWGVDADGNKELLYTKIKTDTLSLAAVDANQYPYLQLVLNNEDQRNLTPAQLNYWRVYGEMNRDVALSVNQDYILQYDSLTTQQSIVIDFAVWNMGNNNIDSAEIEFMIIGGDAISQPLSIVYPSDSVNVQISIPMVGLMGQQHLVAKVKPLKNEANLANNWGWLDFYIPIVPQYATPNELDAKDNKLIQYVNNYPNPFSTQTQIEFEMIGDLPEEVSMEVYDIRGALLCSTIQPAESKNYWVWNGRSQAGESMPSGVYFCRIRPLFYNIKELGQTKQELLEKRDNGGQQLIKMVLAR